MKNDIEHMNHKQSARVAMLETRAAEVERMIGLTGHGGPAEGLGWDGHGMSATHVSDDTFEDTASQGLDGTLPGGTVPDGTVLSSTTDGRTERLITGGRRGAAPKRFAFAREHWKPLSAAAGALAVLALVVTAASSGAPAGTWPASVSRMQSQVSVACENPNVAAEPTQVNFACGSDTRQVLWVFALLTSGGNPGYADPVTGRSGLEPITAAQGGTVAWSLNLHHPYNPASATDSIEVAARALNNIVAGATLTGASGKPTVQGGLESSAANCQRYTGSRALRTRSGYPALCAKPLTKAGTQALVTDVFRQWMTSSPAQTAANAGVLFAHSDDPGNAQVRKILASLPGAGQ